MRCCVTRSAQSFTIYGQTKVYELVNNIEGTNQSTRNALSEVANLIIWNIRANTSTGLMCCKNYTF